MTSKIRLIILLSIMSHVLYGQVNEEHSRLTDSLNLVQLNLETRGDLWKVKWDFTKPIHEWYGIKLNEYGRVFCIDLDGVPDCKSTKNGGNHLHGNLPELDLPFLEHLFLSSNQISGELPTFSGSPYLLTLQLSGNKFEGDIPTFSFLQRLVKLDLEYNNLSGRIPVFEFPHLEALYLGHNNLYGYLPLFENCIHLKHLYINHNKLVGGLPQFFQMHELEQFIFHHNLFEGLLPEYFKLHELNVLNAGENKLEGYYAESEYDNFFSFNIEGNEIQSHSIVDLNIPQGFSPNGDGVNDFFEIDGLNEIKGEDENIGLDVWNTNGKLVYHSDDYNGEWDGTLNNSGQSLLEGLYVYWLKSKLYTHKGSVFIKL
jgi:gliding motility-associated-like protein